MSVMDSHMEIIKQLVDSITSQLTSMLMKIESLKPTLDRLHEDIVNDISIDQDTLNAVRQINTLMDNYKDIISNLPRTIERIENIETKLSTVSTTLSNGLADINTKLEPVYEVNSFLSKIHKHIAWVIGFLLTVPSAVSYIIAWAKDYFSR